MARRGTGTATIGENGAAVLSELAFLSLADEKRVARVDLSKAGRSGVIFVVELSTSKQSEIFFSHNRKRKIDKHGNTEMDFPMDSGPRLLEECAVTDAEDGAFLESLFREAAEEDGAPPQFILVPAERLVYMKDGWTRHYGNVAKMRERLKGMPNSVTSLIAKTVNEISGMGEDEDEVEEKKDS